MTTINKIRWLASILLVFFIVLGTNLIDKSNFDRLRYSVTTIYEDRIVASDLLFEMAMLVQEKEVALVTSDTHFFEKRNEKINHEISGFIERYEQTKLTDREAELFSNLKEELSHLKSLEGPYVQSASADSGDLLQSIGEITQTLHDLSKIQVMEGRQQMFISKKAMDTIDLFTQGEIIFLIVMAVLIQIIILYKPKENWD